MEEYKLKLFVQPCIAQGWRKNTFYLVPSLWGCSNSRSSQLYFLTFQPISHSDVIYDHFLGRQCFQINLRTVRCHYKLRLGYYLVLRLKLLCCPDMFIPTGKDTVVWLNNPRMLYTVHYLFILYQKNLVLCLSGKIYTV